MFCWLYLIICVHAVFFSKQIITDPWQYTDIETTATGYFQLFKFSHRHVERKIYNAKDCGSDELWPWINEGRIPLSLGYDAVGKQSIQNVLHCNGWVGKGRMSICVANAINHLNPS